ncbi:PaaI family thioesterase [Myxococcus stipitatus]|uniref:PaaI family thioesterase n=1 Tax=Myxococcus stipitatus TaxID=83455 RepID=UPI003144E39E
MSEGDAGERTRTVTWADPRAGMAAAKSMSGLEYLSAIARGEVPGAPIARVLGFSLVEVSEGRAVFEVEPAEFHYNPIGTVHGGLAATLLDSALACAVHSTLPVGAGYTTLELHVNLVRAITGDTGRLTCTGEVIHVGGRVATAQGRLTDASGKLYAHGTTTCMVFRPSGPGGRE